MERNTEDLNQAKREANQEANRAKEKEIARIRTEYEYELAQRQIEVDRINHDKSGLEAEVRRAHFQRNRNLEEELVSLQSELAATKRNLAELESQRAVDEQRHAERIQNIEQETEERVMLELYDKANADLERALNG